MKVISVRQYYQGFVSLWGLAAGAPFVPPLLHVFIPDSSAFAEYLYPPLGDIEWVAVAATVGFLLATTFVVFTCRQSKRRIHPRVPILLTVGFAIGMCALIVLYVFYVRRIPVPSVSLEVPVSIGYQRTELAFKTYPQMSDWAMLHDAGPREEQIQLLWTPHSICVVRVLLWAFYTLTVSCFLSVVSLAVYEHAAEQPPDESKDTGREPEANGSVTSESASHTHHER
jgi:hypothetical protein